MKTQLKYTIAFVLAAFFCVSAATELRAATEKEIKANLAKEEDKARVRRDSLKRLTEQEKRLNANLAASETKILNLEKNLAAQQKRLADLNRDGITLDAKYEAVLKERRRTEESLGEVMQTLWELESRLQSVKGKGINEWSSADREYHWIKHLYEAMDTYRAEIEAQEKELEEVDRKRKEVRRDITRQMASIEQDKMRILQDRVKFEQQLAQTRKQKENTQTELNTALRLIDDLNFNLASAKQVSVDIEKAKGKLAKPTNGTLTQGYNPVARPPVHGLGYATKPAATVVAVHPGKVMFNDTMRGLGQVVVVQHGSAYYSVYAFLSSSTVKLGQQVTRGQELGKTGYYPAIKADGLYFELRFHQKAINPTLWLES